MERGELCGDKTNHATFMRRGVEEGLIDAQRVIQLGLRGSRFTPDDIQYGYDAGFTIVTMLKAVRICQEI